MANNNCLEGITCPACGNEDHFLISARVIAEVTDDGADIASPMYGTGFEWGDENYARCPDCDKGGTLRDFQATAQPEADDFAGRLPCVIRSTGDSTDVWSNDTGWGCLAETTRFRASEVATLKLPIGGRWVMLKPYSVLLLYPDYIGQYGEETYYAFVTASDPLEAVAIAQQEAAAAQAEGEVGEPADFAPLLVTEGHHAHVPLFNK